MYGIEWANGEVDQKVATTKQEILEYANKCNARSVNHYGEKEMAFRVLDLRKPRNENKYKKSNWTTPEIKI